MIGSIMNEPDTKDKAQADDQDKVEQSPKPHKQAQRGKTFQGRGVEKKG